jgi:hypothetical protein
MSKKVLTDTVVGVVTLKCVATREPPPPPLFPPFPPPPQALRTHMAQIETASIGELFMVPPVEAVVVQEAKDCVPLKIKLA